MVDAAAASLQPAFVGEVLVLLEHFLSNSLQHAFAAHLHWDGLHTDGLAAHLTLVQAADRRLPAVSWDGDEGGVSLGPRLEIPGHFGFCRIHQPLVMVLVEHHPDGLGALGIFNCFQRLPERI